MTARPTACLPELMQVFFNDYLPHQRSLSPRTIESYRDALRLLLEFIESRDGKTSAHVELADLTPEVIQAFGINNHGQIVGTVQGAINNGNVEGFLATPIEGPGG